MNFEKLVEKVQSEVRALPKRCVDIAAMLKRKRYKGKLNGTMTCVLAKYLSARCRLEAVSACVLINSNEVGVYHKTHGKIGAVAMRPWMRKFVYQFDRGEFPSLVEVKGR